MKRPAMTITVLAILAIASVASAQSRRTSAPTAKPTYAQLVVAGHDYFREGKTRQAYVAAMMAAQMDPKRSEAYALAAAVMHVQGAASEAKYFVDQALARADATERPKLQRLAAAIAKRRAR